MKSLRIAFLVPMLALCAFITADEQAGPELPAFNKAILALIEEYPTDGTHGYWWPRGGESNYDGVSADQFLMGQKVMDGEAEKRTFCCGLTLEVFVKAYDAWLAANPDVKNSPVTPENWQEFQRLWFVENSNGPGPSAALERFNIGRQIEAAEALPGDFVQIWRTKNDRGRMSGHSVVFLDWIRNDAGKIVGMRYWSTQPSTEGINENVEYFGPLGGMSTEYTYYARVDLDGLKAQAAATE